MAQFLTREEVEFLVHLVDDFDIPVLCYGLRADFRGELFPGSYALLVMADELEEHYMLNMTVSTMSQP